MRLIDADAEIAKINQEIQRALAQIKEWEDNREDRGGYHNVDAKIERLKGNINLARAEIACLESYNTAYDVDKVIERLESFDPRNDCPPKHRNVICHDRECGECWMEYAIEIVKQAATEHNNGWIPCSERSPEDGEEVLVTDGKHVYLVKYDADLDASFGDMDGIVAWQPLPKPYEPKGE